MDCEQAASLRKAQGACESRAGGDQCRQDGTQAGGTGVRHKEMTGCRSGERRLDRSGRGGNSNTGSHQMVLTRLTCCWPCLVISLQSWPCGGILVKGRSWRRCL